MAITFEEQKGSPTAGTYDARGQRTYTRMFNVISETSDDLGNVLLAFPDLPGQDYPNVDTGAFVTQVSASRDADILGRWTGRAEYSTQIDTEGADRAATQIDDPTEMATITRWGAAFEPDVMDRDARNIPLVNTVGRPFDPPVEQDDHYQVITRETNSATFDTAHFNTYINTINSDVFLGFQPGEVKCANISAQTRFKGTFEYVNATFEFHVKTKDLVPAWDHVTKTQVTAKGWDKVVLNQGFYYITNSVAAAGGAVPVVERIPNWRTHATAASLSSATDKLEWTDEPSLLDDLGGVITADQILKHMNGAVGGLAPTWVKFQQYESLPFSGTGVSS